MKNEAFAEESSAARPKKKRRAGLIIFLIVLIAAVAASVAYYFIQKQKPEKTVTEFLSCAQDMDFDKMADLLQSNDLSALDNADIRNDNYIEFFRGINKKMTFEIIKNDSYDIKAYESFRKKYLPKELGNSTKLIVDYIFKNISK